MEMAAQVCLCCGKRRIIIFIAYIIIPVIYVAILEAASLFCNIALLVTSLIVRPQYCCNINFLVFIYLNSFLTIAIQSNSGIH